MHSNIGPAVAIKNSSLLAVVIMSWLILDQTISYLQWIFIGVLFFGLFVTSAGDSIVQSWGKKKEKVNGAATSEIECKMEKV